MLNCTQCKSSEKNCFDSKPRGASLKATEQPIDTGTAAGKCFLDMLGVFAESWIAGTSSAGLALSKGAQRGQYSLALRLFLTRQSAIDCPPGWSQCRPLRTSSQDHAFAASTPEEQSRSCKLRVSPLTR
jgi:hypothetical protein